MRRTAAWLCIAGAVVVGGASRVWPIGNSLWDKSTGDAAYAVMIFFVVAAVRPHARSIILGVVALALCIAIETFQLTGIPARLPRLLQIALGTRFAWHDVACYVVGASLATLLHASLSRSVRREALSPRSRRGACPSSSRRRAAPSSRRS